MSRLFQFSLMTIAYEVLNDFLVKKKKKLITYVTLN